MLGNLPTHAAMALIGYPRNTRGSPRAIISGTAHTQSIDATLFAICVVSHQYSWSLPVTSCITTFEAIHNVAVVVK